MRTDVNDKNDKNEAIWVIREIIIPDDEKKDDLTPNFKDYYSTLSSSKHTTPPQTSWICQEYGQEPVPVFNFEDIIITTPSKPNIIEIKPIISNAAMIYFECDEKDRRFQECPFMKVWYEIEIKHYNNMYNIYNMNTKSLKRTISIKTDKSPFKATNLMERDDYEFVVSSCNDWISCKSNRYKFKMPKGFGLKTIKCEGGGTSDVNGTYSVETIENDSFIFINNKNLQSTLCRRFYPSSCFVFIS